MHGLNEVHQIEHPWMVDDVLVPRTVSYVARNTDGTNSFDVRGVVVDETRNFTWEMLLDDFVLFRVLRYGNNVVHGQAKIFNGQCC